MTQPTSAAPAGEIGTEPLLEALARREHTVMLDLARQHGFATVQTSEGMESLWSEYDRQSDALKAECRAVPERVLRWIAEEGYALTAAPEPERDPAAGGREADRAPELAVRLIEAMAGKDDGLAKLLLEASVAICAAAPTPQVAEPSGVDEQGVIADAVLRLYTRPAPPQESALREALEGVEWRGPVKRSEHGGAILPTCPACGGLQQYGHEPGCYLAAALSPQPGGSDAG